METELADLYLDDAAATEARRLIKRAAGRDTFMLATLDPDGRVHDVTGFLDGASKAATAAISARVGFIVLRSVSRYGGELWATDADGWLAQRLARRSIQLAIVDTKATEIALVPAKPPEPVTPEEVRTFFAPDGPLAAVVPGYETREAQVIMAENVAGAISDRLALLVEAGTGVGKGLAYLVPAIIWATRNHLCVVVATHTINLQEQIIQSDLALLAKAGLTFNVAVAKGRDNYACLLKANDLLEGTLDTDSADENLPEAAALAEWAFEHTTGSRADLGSPPTPRAWSLVACESDACARRRCDYYTKCHYFNARDRVLAADIIIANQHLLCADLVLRRGEEMSFGPRALPFYDRVIVDEAHHLDEVATEMFGTSIGTSAIRRVLQRVIGSEDRATGLLRRTAERLRGTIPLNGSPAREYDHLATYIETVALPKATAIERRLAEHLAQLESAAAAVSAHFPRTHAEGAYRLRITDDVESTSPWRHALVPAAESTTADLVELKSALMPVVAQLADFMFGDTPQWKWSHTRLDADSRRLGDIGHGLEAFVGRRERTDPPAVRWIESKSAKKPGDGLRLESVPLWVGPELSDTLFKVAEGGVFTSATLSVQDSFEAAEMRLGLDRLARGRSISFSVPSPFDYARNAALVVVDDLPHPDQAKQHIDGVVAILERAIMASRGRALVLTTSMAALDQIHAQLWARLKPNGIRVLSQRDSTRSSLTATLRADEGVALVATKSFWEGVDVRGEALSLVAITRLPFPVPTDPLVAARAELLDAEGGNGFRDYAIPAAVVTFKQGVGRLIRHRKDRGVVLVLDSRAATADYGPAFTDLPGWGPPEILPSEEAARFVETWFSHQKS